jgi:hypothetical protein
MTGVGKRIIIGSMGQFIKHEGILLFNTMTRRINMNIWLGVFTVIFILITSIIIYLKKRKIQHVIWNIVRLIIVGVALYIGRDASEFWPILICSIIIGACLLISILHAYNKLFTSDTTYDPIGENKKPKTFGTDYWR